MFNVLPPSLKPCESGIFHYIDHHQRDGMLCGKPVLRKTTKDGREVWFVYLLMDEHSGFKAHLSFDQLYIETGGKSPLDYFFTYVHFTFTGQYQGDEIIAHAYYNRHGILINCNAFKYLLDKSQHSMTMTDFLRDFIYEKADTYASDFLQSLLNEKMKYYSELQEEFSEIEFQLAMDQEAFSESGYQSAEKKEAAIEKINLLLRKIQEINLYDESKSDKREFLLKANLKYLEESVFISSPDSAATESESPPENMDAKLEVKIGVIHPSRSVDQRPSQKRKKRKDISTKKQTVKIDSELDNEFELINRLALFSLVRNVPTAINCHSIHSVLSYLRTLSLSSENSFYSLETIKIIENSYKLLMHYFKEQVLNGNLNEVTFLYPFIADFDQKNMQKFFVYFLNQIEQSKDEEAIKLSLIGDFFYKHSENYRIAVSLINSRVFISIDLERGRMQDEKLSLLLKLFTQNKLAAFQMFLRQGVRAISPLTECMYKGIRISLPMTILCEFMVNPNLAFINELRKHKALEGEQTWTREIYHTNLKELDHRYHLSMLTSTKSPISFVLRRLKYNTQYSYELIQNLAEHADLRSIIAEMPNVLNHPDFRFLVVPCSNAGGLYVMKNRSKAAEASAKLMRPKSDVLNNKIAILFFPEGGVERPIHAYLLSKIAQDFPRLELSQQQEIIQLLMSETENAIKHPDQTEQMLCIITQFCNSLLENPTVNDLENRIRLFCFRAVICKNEGKIEISNNFYAQSERLFNDLSSAMKTSDVFVTIREDFFLRQISTFTEPAIERIKILYNMGKYLEEKLYFEKSKKQYENSKQEYEKIPGEKCPVCIFVLTESIERVQLKISAQALSIAGFLSHATHEAVSTASITGHASGPT